jgi:hypothetical protein
MTDKKTCEIFIAMNEDGDYVVCTDESEALEKLAEDQGGWPRVIKVIVKMSPPVMTEATIEVSDEAGTVQSLEIEAA